MTNDIWPPFKEQFPLKNSFDRPNKWIYRFLETVKAEFWNRLPIIVRRRAETVAPTSEIQSSR